MEHAGGEGVATERVLRELGGELGDQRRVLVEVLGEEHGAPASLAREEARFRAAGKGPWVAEASGFNVHAGVTVRSGDREGLERSCRYGARPK